MQTSVPCITEPTDTQTGQTGDMPILDATVDIRTRLGYYKQIRMKMEQLNRRENELKSSTYQLCEVGGEDCRIRYPASQYCVGSVYPYPS